MPGDGRRTPRLGLGVGSHGREEQDGGGSLRSSRRWGRGLGWRCWDAVGEASLGALGAGSGQGRQWGFGGDVFGGWEKWGGGPLDALDLRQPAVCARLPALGPALGPSPARLSSPPATPVRPWEEMRGGGVRGGEGGSRADDDAHRPRGRSDRRASAGPLGGGYGYGRTDNTAEARASVHPSLSAPLGDRGNPIYRATRPGPVPRARRPGPPRPAQPSTASEPCPLLPSPSLPPSQRGTGPPCESFLRTRCHIPSPPSASAEARLTLRCVGVGRARGRRRR